MAALPAEVRRQARLAYRQFVANPRHPGLHFKQIHGSDRLVAVVNVELASFNSNLMG